MPAVTVTLLYTFAMRFLPVFILRVPFCHWIHNVPMVAPRHLDNFIKYDLYKGEKRLRGFVAKRAHCIVDSQRSALYQGTQPVSFARKYTCQNQGIQVGWQDLYV